MNVKGLNYKDKLRKADGVAKMKLKAGTGGRGKLIVKAKGENIPPLPLPMTGPVTVQLINGNGECWGAEYTIKKNTSLFFKGKR